MDDLLKHWTVMLMKSKKSVSDDTDNVIERVSSESNDKT